MSGLCVSVALRTVVYDAETLRRAGKFRPRFLQREPFDVRRAALGGA
jgi:hypothetical protein